MNHDFNSLLMHGWSKDEEEFVRVVAIKLVQLLMSYITRIMNALMKAILDLLSLALFEPDSFFCQQYCLLIYMICTLCTIF